MPAFVSAFLTSSSWKGLIIASTCFIKVSPSCQGRSQDPPCSARPRPAQPLNLLLSRLLYAWHVYLLQKRRNKSGRGAPYAIPIQTRRRGLPSGGCING